MNEIDFTDINIYLVFFGLFNFLIFMYQRDWFIKEKPFKFLLIFSSLSFLIGLYFSIIGFKREYWGIIFLYVPIYHLALYRMLRYFFLRLTAKEPIDTAYDFQNITPWPDRIFNIIYSILATLVPMFFLILLLM